MKKNQHIQSTFLLQVVVYSTSLVVFLGLVATLGINTFLSQLFFFTATETAYIQPFQQINGIIFWWAIGVLFFFTAFCSTFFRWAHVLSLSEKPHSPSVLFTKFCHAFIAQWGLVILLVVLCWTGGRFVATHIRDIPVIPQESVYENRADYYERIEPIKFSPPTAIHESYML